MTYADLTESDKADLYEGGASLIRPLLDSKPDKSTTLAGYGIQDAYTKAELNDALAAKAEKVHQHTVSQITDMPAIPSKTSDLENNSGFVTEPEVIEHTNAAVTINLTPNVIHHITGATAITVSSVEDTFKECFLQFVSGESAPTLTMPGTIKWAGSQAPTLEANMTYQISVVKLCAVCVGYKEVTA